MKRTLIIASIATIISACGFHLRGLQQSGYKFPFKTIYLQCDTTTICYDLNNAIHNQNLVSVVSNPKDSEVTINVFNERTSKNVQGYNAAGRIASYKLTYQIDAKVTKNKEQFGDTIHVSVNSTLNYNDSQVLSANQDEASQWAFLHKNATNQLLKQLVYLKPSKNPED